MHVPVAARRLPAIVAGLLLAAAVLLLAAPAHANPLARTAAECPGQPISNPFAQWGDDDDYAPVPGGAFEGEGPAWETTDDAAVVPGNEPFFVRSADDANSLSIPAGNSATSASQCVSVNIPTMRFFAVANGTKAERRGSFLRVEVLFEGPNGNTRSLPIGLVKAPKAWTPSSSIRIIANLIPLITRETAAVAFRFTPVGSADWQIDDVYVDPKSRI